MKNYKYKMVAIVVSVLAICIMLLTIVSFTRITETMSQQTMSSLTQTDYVIIDAGHGGFDPGTQTPDGAFFEKDVNLEIALVMKEVFEAHGENVIMIRESDMAVGDNSLNTISQKKKSDINARVDLANSYGDGTVYISIHQNAYSDSSESGTQILYGNKNEQSEVLAKIMHETIKQNLQPDNRREIKKGNSDIFILNNIEIPTVLIECGFLTNTQETEKLVDPEYQRLLSYIIYEGYIEYKNSKQ